jgi:hypothetical protein
MRATQGIGTTTEGTNQAGIIIFGSHDLFAT